MYQFKDLQLSLGLYQVRDFAGREGYGLAISAKQNGEPYATLTVSFGEFIGAKNCAYMDTNNCPWVKELLKEGIAEDTRFTKMSGFCTYPLYRFSESFLKSVDAGIYQHYSDSFDKLMEF